MYKIKPVKKLTAYEDYANATVFEYNDGEQRFYFDAAFRTIEVGTSEKPYKYAVVVTLLGKTDPCGTVGGQWSILIRPRRILSSFLKHIACDPPRPLLKK